MAGTVVTIAAIVVLTAIRAGWLERIARAVRKQ